MKAVVQRVLSCGVTIDGIERSSIGRGLLVLLAVEHDDDNATAEKLAKKMLAFRIFADDAGKMNLNITQANGELMIVSQFTLAANTQNGNRPSFTSAAPPALAQQLYEYFVTVLKRETSVPVQTGVFAADMQVSLINDGPVTFTFQV